MTDEQIRKRCNQLADTLIRKNANYGGAVERSPILFPGLSPKKAITVRMSDKVARFAALNSGEPDKVGESLEDTAMDLAGYCIIYCEIKE